MANIGNLQIKLFKNESDNPKAPAFTGMLLDRDNNFAKVAEISCWYADDRDSGERKVDRNGNPFLSGRTQEPRS